MKKKLNIHQLITVTFGCYALLTSQHGFAAGEGWSVVPYLGLSQLSNQSGTLTEADDIGAGGLNIDLDVGFSAGLSVRYDYSDSKWTSEFGWEYRSNDSSITSSDGTKLNGGNYASNTFFLNGRYAVTDGKRWTPWVGGGLTLIQEIDIDSESAAGERSFSDSGSAGFQVMAGVDYGISERLYLTSELRYSSQVGLDLSEEGAGGRVSDIDYNPITLGLGIGLRF